MRILSLTLTGIGPFAGTESVDFRHFADTGLFLLRGDTGAGKSTVLNALVYGLYGTTKDANPRLVSDHKAPETEPSVVVEFAVGDAEYRIERVPAWSRPKRRGQGITAERTRGALFRRTGGAWEDVTSNQQEIGKAVTEIVGLTREQFLQVVLLQQGRFARFLMADDKERREILERLFAAEPYAHIQERLREKARELREGVEGELAAREAHAAAARGHAEEALRWGLRPSPVQEDEGPDGIREEPAWDAAELAGALGEEAVRQASASEDARAAAERAESELTRHAALLTSLRDWARVIEAADRLAEGAEAAAASEGALARHRRAETVMGAVEAARREAAEAQTRGEEADRAAASLAEARSLVPEWAAGDSEAEAQAQAWEERAERVREAVRLGELILRRDTARVTAGSAVEDARTGATRAAQGAAEADEAAAAALERHAALAAAIGDPTAAAHAVTTAAERVDVAGRAEAAEQACRAGEERLGRASAEEAVALEALAVIRRRFAEQVAPRLAAQLQDGEPCLVCGSVEHPEPAAYAAEGSGVTEAEIESAETELTERRHAREGAHRDLERARERLAGLNDQLGGASRSELEAQLASAQAQAEEIQTRQAAAEAAAGEATAAQADAQRAQLASAEAAARLAAADAAHAAARAELDRALEDWLTAAAEAGWPGAEAAAGLPEATPVAAAAAGLPEATPVAAAGAARDELASAAALLASSAVAARACETARTRAQDAQERASAAAAAQTARLKESAFADAEDAANSLLSPEAVREAEERVACRDRDRHRVRDAIAGAAGVSRDTAWQPSPEVRAALEGCVEGRPDGQDIPWRPAWALALGQAEATGARLARARRILALRRDALVRRHAAVASLAVQARRTADALQDIDDRLGPALEALQRVSALAETANGRGPDNERRMALQAFVLASRLEDIAAAASQILHEMSGRYEIVYDDTKKGLKEAGLGLAVVDHWTLASRAPESLSGGEMFMASLSLALGLARVVQEESGGIELGTLFIDEGFGSLDAETLDTVMEQIEALRADGGRTIGIVSHVTEMHGRIGHQIMVSKTQRGSTLSTRSDAGV
ncbi:SMC family ATPase [Falsarthrobacter nasiphocae]|uniref:Nuclease SbcCD subunit C n=1 Tax=Falsarthrobacter nasiphocae TaxID=189863 RepID=A0AAE3YII2_9MICC|nr:SMC family ATPase [Falsarthrobacter nasiphocae]MDR6892804.1 exonuclease SbcC [Falsarthrobacter nasiphocae]